MDITTMKKILIALWTTIVLVGGSPQAFAAGESDFEQGVALFKQENYRQALIRFQAARDAGMMQPKLDYNMGVCYFRLGQYGQAKQAFMQAAKHPPLRDLSHYNIGLVEEALNRQAEADTWFRRVQAETDNPKLKALAANRLGDRTKSGSSDAGSSSAWFGGFSLAAGYDDNIEDPSQVGVTDKGDNFAKLLLYTSGLLQGTHRDGVRLGLSGYFLRYEDATAYDLNLLQARLDKTFSLGTWQDKAGVGVEQTTLGSNDYLRTVKLSLSGEKPVSSVDSINLRYRYSDITSLDTLYDKLEGLRHEAELGWERKYSGSRYRASYEYEVNDRNDYEGLTTFTSYSPTRHTLELRADVEPARNWELGGRISWRRSIYADENILADSSHIRREDDRGVVGVGLSRRLTGSLKLNLDYKYTDNDSNINGYDYMRNLYSLGLSANF